MLMRLPMMKYWVRLKMERKGGGDRVLKWMKGRIVLQIKLVIFFIHILQVDRIVKIYQLLMSFSADNLPELEAHLATHQTLTEGGSPGPLDAFIYLAIGKLPDVNTHPNLHFWYLHIGTFYLPHLKAWAEKYTPTAPKKEAKKEEEQIDLFGDSEPAATPAAEKPKPKVEPKKKKEKPIAKSIVVFEVKVYEAGFDLLSLANRVYALEIDGLIWNKEPKILEVAYGVQKLQVGCVIEDDKVLTDDIFDKITAWEDDVQSVDMISMQKL